MGFEKRRETSSALGIPDSSRKEIEYLFLHDIVDTVERCKIPLSVILNLDQTPLKYVPVGNEKMALGVTIEGSSYKPSINGTFAIMTLSEFLPCISLIRGKPCKAFQGLIYVSYDNICVINVPANMTK